MSSVLKQAARSDDLAALKQWLATDRYNLDRLREILGTISSQLNDASAIFKEGTRSWSPDTAKRAAAVLPDLDNLEALQQIIQQVQASLAQDDSNQSRILQRMAYGIQQARFSPDQVEQIRRISQGQAGAPSFVEEVDSTRMNKFLKQSIYSTADDAKKSEKVLREILQNAVDAVSRRGNEEEGFEPTIEITYHGYGKSEPPYMDMLVKDNGVGMDWPTLSDKFFRYFVSGKEEEEEATGGFGIAKALIQETPQHGWTIDTNDIHSSRFGRNVYMGTPRSEQVRPAVPKVVEQGTTIGLYGIPYMHPYAFDRVCSTYASGGVTIVVNGQPVEPKFNLAELPVLDESLSVLSQAIGKSELEKQIVKDVSKDAMKDEQPNLGDLSWERGGRKTSINFSVREAEYGGQLYVFVNGQYQFTRHEYLPKVDLICNIRTNTRPGDDDYPLDPGRENMREPYDGEAKKILTFMKKILERIAENYLFKEGLNVTMFNKEAEPLSTVESEPAVEEERQQLMRAFEAGAGMGLYTEEKEKAEGQELAKHLTNMARAGTLDQFSLNEQQKSILDATVEALDDSKDRINIKEELEKIIDGLSTPAAMMVQRDFVGLDTVENEPGLTSNLMILWQSIIKEVTDTATKYIRSSRKEPKSYIPGAIFSNESVALFMRPQSSGGPYTIAINPISVASLVEPKAFGERLGTEASEEAMPVHAKEAKEINASDRVSAFLMHAAIHEVTHLLFPDQWGNQQFHVYVTQVENACHFIYPEIKKEVRKYMKGLRKDTNKLLRRVSRDRSKRASAKAWVKDNCRFDDR